MDAMADSPLSVPMDTSLTEDGESLVQNAETPIANTSSSVGVDSTLQQSATVSINKSVEEASTNCSKGNLLLVLSFVCMKKISMHKFSFKFCIFHIFFTPTF